MRRALLLLPSIALACAEPTTRAEPAPSEPDAGPVEPSFPAPTCAAFAEATQLGTLRDDDLDELSGLASSRRDPGLLWAHEDSGNEAELYALERTGRRLATVRLDGAENVDWEDLALGPCDAGSCLYVADVGDNAEERDDLAILRLTEPAAQDGLVQAQRFPFRYPDGPQDAEALVVDPTGRPIVLTKRKDGTTRLYAIPLQAGRTSTAELLSTLDVLDGASGLFSAVTAADLSADGRSLLVRTYGSAFVFRLPTGALDRPDAMVRVTLPVAAEPQGEALAWDPVTGGAVHASEGAGAALYGVPCAP